MLNGRRNLTIEMIRHLRDGLGSPAEVLIQPDRAERNPAVGA
jgi:antitoxin component HigA of HigAB toxin-antitoxin module